MSVPQVKDSAREPAQGESAILDAARDILATRGVEGLSMRQVAEQVGVSATAIYHYFEGKQDLVNRVILSAFDTFGAYLNEAMSGHPEGSVERIVALGEGYLKFALENQAYFRVMFSISPEDREGLGELPDAGGYQLLRSAVVDAVKAHTLRGLDPELQEAFEKAGVREDAHADVLSMFLWSTAHGLVTLALCGAADHCELEHELSALDLYHVFDTLLGTGVLAECPQRGGTEENEKEKDG